MRPVIVGIGGAHSGAGKTAYASLLLRKLKGWGAIKYTKTGLYCSIIDDRAVLSQEDKDTRRMLDSGAGRVLWIQSPPSELAEVLPLAVGKLSDLKGIIVEGNSAIEFLSPDIIIFIFGSDITRIKESARGILKKADVIIFSPRESSLAGISELSRSLWPGGSENVKIFNMPDAAEESLHFITGMIEAIEKIRLLLNEGSVDGKISCPLARKIARELSVSYKEVGRVADELNIKITDCELGCF